MNNLMKFILDNSNWFELLQQDPFNLIIKSDEDYPDVYLFKYNQYSSDMTNKICQEARGIILKIKDNYIKLLCHSFDKFFNYTEPGGQVVLENFNWDNYTFQEKRDGSLMRLWYYEDKNTWNISTSGTIDAFKAVNQIPSCPYNSFGDMFKHLLDTYEIDLNALDKDYTYSFEMTSPDNKIVVDYDKDELTLIGIRDNLQNIELDPYTNNPFTSIKNPEKWKYKSLDEALSIINDRHNFEGLVLCDDHYRRVKIKTTEYLSLAKIADETSSDRGILRLILENRIDDVQTQLPHVRKRIERVQSFIRSEVEAIFMLYQQVDFTKERKDIAIQLKGNPYSAFVFRRLNNPEYDFVEDYFRVENLEKIYKTYKEKTGIKDIEE